jgi:predicted Co/Zn/Cd cation transporter (cation efflux family)
MESSQVEARALRLSLGAYLFMAILGIAFAVLTRSNAILLDGSFNFISLVISLLAMRVSRLQDVHKSESFHFGFAQFEPLLNTGRIIMILGVSAFAVVNAVRALLHGGVPVSAGLAVFYGAIAATGCVLVGLKQRAYSRQCNSTLVRIDAETWVLNAGVSAAAGLAFLVAFLLQGTGWSHVVPYVDPVFVIGTVLLFIWTPIRSLGENAREVLSMAPSIEMQEEVHRRLSKATEELPATDMHLSMTKVGRYFYVLAHFVMPADHRFENVAAMDRQRERMAATLSDIEPRLVLDAVFVADEKWATALDVRASEAPASG